MGPEVNERRARERDGVLELEKLKEMVSAWKANYLRIAEESGGGDFLCDDFQEEINENVMPYMRRLLETQHISDSQVQDFLRFCSLQVKDLHNRMQEEA
ncbi:MAG: hypothetical protein AB9866_29545 [Syntrophobacteraceae bacterium]